MLDEFNCAVQKGVTILQGRLFVSDQALYFYSIFNYSTFIFGQETKIKINYSEIGDIKKAKNAKIFHNSILVKLRVGMELFLTSFLSRDECFRLILKQLKKYKKLESIRMLENESYDDMDDTSSISINSCYLPKHHMLNKDDGVSVKTAPNYL